MTLKNEEINVDLSNLFYYRQKLIFNVPFFENKNRLMKSNKDIYTFYDYSPAVFANFRLLFGIKSELYRESVSNVDQIQTKLLTGQIGSMRTMDEKGKSGSIFFFSLDGLYLFKSVPKSEFSFLRRILPEYTRHVFENGNSLINKIVGMHKLRKGKNKHYLLIMQNIICNKVFSDVIKFDLKGSIYKRMSGPNKSPLKDQDFLILKNKENFFFSLAPQIRRNLLGIIEKDSEFLSNCQINDYSLLIGCLKLEPTDRLFFVNFREGKPKPIVFIWFFWLKRALRKRGNSYH
jgi:1-phosphatidylinositol-4-phosphate 5-kinase